MKVSIVIPVFNQLQHTINCLRDLLKTSHPIHEIIVVDDGSKREPISKAISKLFPQVILLSNNENLGFARTVNKGIRYSSGDIIVLMNNDILLPNTKWLDLMLNAMEKRGLDMVAPKGGRMTKDWTYIPGEASKETDDFIYLPFWCCAIKREIFDKIGLISEAYGRGFFEDVDFNVMAKRAGAKPGIVENTGVQHLYHTTFKASGYNLTKEYEEKRKIFLKKVKEL